MSKHTAFVMLLSTFMSFTSYKTRGLVTNFALVVKAVADLERGVRAPANFCAATPTSGHAGSPNRSNSRPSQMSGDQ